jgi:hypothetical protein
MFDGLGNRAGLEGARIEFVRERIEELEGALRTIRNTFSVGSHCDCLVPIWAQEVRDCADKVLP